MVKKKMKKSFWQYFVEGFKKLKEHPVIILAVLILFALIVAIQLFSTSLISSNTQVQQIMADPTMLSTMDSASLMSFMSSLLPATLVLILAGIIIFLISSYFLAGVTAMAFDITKKKKISLKSMFSYGKKFFFRFLGISIVLGIIDGVLSLVLLIPSVSSQEGLTIVLSFCITLITSLFGLSKSYLIIQNNGVFASIGKSFSIVRKNYLRFVLLAIMFGALMALIELIPYAGVLISSVIIVPAEIIAYVLFALDHK